MEANNKENKIIINLDMTESDMFESNIEVDGTPFIIKFMGGNKINITMTEGFAARHNMRVQKGMSFSEGDFRQWSESPIMKGSINILGLEMKDSYFKRFHDTPGRIYMGLDYFENANFDMTNRKITLITTQEHFNGKLAERNSQYSEYKNNDVEPADVPNPIINLHIHEYAYEPMEYIMRISEEIFKCCMGEYGDDSDKFLEEWDCRDLHFMQRGWSYESLKKEVSREEMDKQYKQWKESPIEHIWKPV